MAGDELPIDPALRQQLLTRTGSTGAPGDEAAGASDVLAVVARLDPADSYVPGLRVVSRFGAVVTGRVRLADLLDVRRHRAVRSLKQSRIYAPTLDASLGDVRARPRDLRVREPSAGVGAGTALTGAGVLVAVLDWGLDVTHANLRKSDGTTRVEALWDQRGGASPTSPAPFGYGRVLTESMINAALGSADPHAALGYDHADVDPRGEGTHGTHVTDIAVGNGRAPGSSPGVAPGARVLFCHLRAQDTGPHDSLGDSARLLEAVDWAVRTAGERPLVVQMSLGRTGGAHDASLLVVRALDHLLATRPGVAVVMSCGNYRDSRMHAGLRLAPDTEAVLPWQVLAPPPEGSELELWCPAADRVRVSLTAPDGRQLMKLSPGAQAVVRNGTTVIASGFSRTDEPNSGANMVDLFLWPGAPTGTYLVTVQAIDVRDGRIHSWIERTSTRHQSRFSPEVATQDSTTGSICNGWLPLAVGAYDARDSASRLVSFSSQGPSRDDRAKPDLSAPGWAVVAARSSVPAPGGRLRDGVVPKSGTSMAAPHASGAVALVFEAALPRRLPMAVTRWILMESARQDPPSSPASADQSRYGAGRLDARAACLLTRALLAPADPTLVRTALPARRSETERNKAMTTSHMQDAVLSWLGGAETPPASMESTGVSIVEADDPLDDAEVLEAAVAAATPLTPAPPTTTALSASRSASAQTWNAAHHDADSGVTGRDLARRVASYIDMPAARKVATDAGVTGGTAPFDAGCVEGIHQFQAAMFSEAGQVDGMAGGSTLDTLGFVRRPGMNPVAQSNAAAQRRLNRVDADLAPEFTAATWWEGMVNPAWLGQRFRNGIHLVLARKLRQAEGILLAQRRYAGLSGVALGAAVGIAEGHKGARPTSTTASMHTFGLAVDIEYQANPWIVGQHVDSDASGPSPAGLVTQAANARMTSTINRAALLVDGATVNVTAAYLSRLARGSAGDAWDDLHRLHTAFVSYLGIAGDVTAARQLVDARQAVAGVRQPGEAPDAAARRWAAQASSDLAALRAGAVTRKNARGNDISVARSNFTGRDPRRGFLSLSRDLVVALRDDAGLAWGAVDFGATESGDIMHFDCRRDGVGRILRNA